MNQIAIHATTIPDAPALRYLGKTLSWGELHWRVGVSPTRSLAAASGPATA